MPIVRRSVVVEAPVEITFNTSNALEDWPEMMDDYSRVEVLRREGLKIWFRITPKSGSSWTSWRIVCPEGLFALAERHEPKAPFEFMQIIWTYRSLSANTSEMTWEMSYELPVESQANADQAFDYLRKHTESNQNRMKAHIEALHASRPR